MKFGKENINRLPGKTIYDILIQGNDAVVELIRELYFNPDFPEYHNIYIDDMESPYAIIYDGEDWVEVEKVSTVESLIDLNMKRLEKIYVELKKAMGGRTLPEFEQFERYIREHGHLFGKPYVKYRDLVY